jgi:phage gp29-like protein
MLDKFADRMDIPVSHVRSKYKIPAPEKGEELLRPKMAAQFTARRNAPGYMAVAGIDARSGVLDDLVPVLERLGDQADGMVTDRLNRIREIMDQSGSMQEMKTRLSDAFSDLPDDDLGTLIAEAMATANLMARYRVADDAGLVEGSDA